MSPLTNGPADELAGIDAELRAYAGRTAPDASPAFLDRLELTLAAQLPPPADAPSLVIVKPSTSIVVPAALAAAPASGRRFSFGSPLRVTMRLGLAMGLLALSAVGVFAATGVIPQELLPWNGGVVSAPVATPEPTEPPTPRVLVEQPAAPAVEPVTDETAEPSDDPAEAAGEDADATPDASHPTHDAPDAIEDLGGDSGDDSGSDGSDGSDGGDDSHDDGSSGDGGDSSDGGDATDAPDGDSGDAPDATDSTDSSD